MRVVKIVVPPDKSISHRAIMLTSISEGITCIKNLLMAEDCLRTIEAFRAMGVQIESQHVRGLASDTVSDVVVHGVGLRGLQKPARPIYLGNSGTTMRILPGILAGQDFEAVLRGDSALSKRPMKRIVGPLRKMGAKVSGSGIEYLPSRSKEVYPPIKIRGGKLKGITYKSKIASAQVKSCILLAGLFADGLTEISEPTKSRDHTERMLKRFGCDLKVQGLKVSLKCPVKLKSPGVIEIPGDISSAAFFIVAGCILPNTKIIIKNVGLNPTRTGIIHILRRMGADIEVHSPQSIVHSPSFASAQDRQSPPSSTSGGLRRTGIVQSYEPVGDIIVKSSKLKGILISPEEVVKAIDEIPILMLAGCFAKGRTVIRGVGELRVKETDRIKSMVTNLRKLGADVEVIGEKPGMNPNEVSGSGISVIGGEQLHGARVSSFGDHRTAMSMLVAGLLVKGQVVVTDTACINKSFPGFENLLSKLN